MLLEGRAVLITGAGQGLGAGIAMAAAEEGAAVMVTDVRQADVERTAAQVQAAFPERSVLAFPLDVSETGSIQSAIDHAVAAFGHLDGLVNNAGVIRMGPALDVSSQEWNWHFEINVTGLMTCCRLFASYVRSRANAPAGAAIVNVASNAGKVGFPNMAAYNASKAAVISLTRSLASEWSEYHLNVNAVCPGSVATPMLRAVAEWIASQTGGDIEELFQSMTPRQLGRHVQPIEVGRIVAFLLSDRATIIRGQSINVDGGETPY